MWVTVMWIDLLVEPLAMGPGLILGSVSSIILKRHRYSLYYSENMFTVIQLFWFPQIQRHSKQTKESEIAVIYKSLEISSLIKQAACIEDQLRHSALCPERLLVSWTFHWSSAIVVLAGPQSIKTTNADKTIKENVIVKVIFELEPKGSEEELYVYCVED
ncbi:hypothetical protein STEG23_021184 [Scotinomys teguina]